MENRIHLLIIFLFFSTIIAGQEELAELDSLIFIQDSIAADTTLHSGIRVSPEAVEFSIVYNAIDTLHLDQINQKVYLVNGATATYGDIYLAAYYIDVDLATSEVFARGRIDSTGKLVDTPIFRRGDQEEFESKELIYNFKSKRAIIRNIKTEQEGGFLLSEVTKMHDDGTLHAGGSKFTTCDADEPHFYLKINKSKVIPGEKFITGPASLVVADIPLPLALPFGFFPVQKKVTSGIVMPKYGEERNRGYFLKDGGYYFAINDYLDLKLTGDIYTNGTWRSVVNSNYRKLYKFNGSFAFSWASNVTGYKGLANYSRSPNYSIRWSHSQDAKSMPGSRLSASVNMSSSGFDRDNSYQVMEHITTTKSSSISYSKTWAGTPFNFSTSFNHSQNTQNKTVTVNLPKMSFGASRIYPLKSKKGGTTKWWQELQMQYTASLDNRINTTDSLLFTKQVWDNMDNGFRHEIPISIPIRPFNNFNISPQLRYSGVMYTRMTRKTWVEDYFDPETNEISDKLIEEQVPGLYYGQALSPQISASYSPQVYGTYEFRNPDSKIIAIRHVVKPSVSFSLVPSIEGLSSDMYRRVQSDTLGNFQEYSIYQEGIYGTPSLASKSGNLSFSLTNIIEAKVRNRNDTTGKGEKVKIIDNLGLTSAYNIFADSLRWSPIRLTMRTQLMKEIDISASGSLDPYALDSLNRRINTSAWSNDRQLARLTSFNVSLGFNLGSLINNITGRVGKVADPGTSGDDINKPDQGLDPALLSGAERDMEGEDGIIPSPGSLMFDDYGYADFNVPWSLRFAYTFFYTKPRDEAIIKQNFTVSGDLTLTKAWKLRYSSGYDISAKKITMTSVGITRDLHCWEMSFNWIPVGYLQSWDFTIRVKSSVLQDLKYERRKDFHDNQ